MINIYFIKCLASAKGYVGITGKSLRHRLRQHEVSSRRLGKRPQALPLAIAKYGKENFIIGLIEQAPTYEIAHKREAFWITTLNTLSPNGYNLTAGGEGASGWIAPDHIRDKMKQAADKRWSDENEVQQAREKTLAAYERDPELKKKAGDGLIAARATDKWKEANCASLRTPEYRERRSAIATEIASRPEFKKKQVEINRKRMTTPEGRAHQARMTNAARRPGEANANSLLTEAIVRFIKSDLGREFRGVDLAIMFGVKKATISAVQHGRNWGHIK